MGSSCYRPALPADSAGMGPPFPCAVLLWLPGFLAEVRCAPAFQGIQASPRPVAPRLGCSKQGRGGSFPPQ